MRAHLVLSLLAAWPFSLEHVLAQEQPAPAVNNFDVTSTSNACAPVMGYTGFFDAVLAYNCLISTPFDKEIAKSLLKYWQDTIQFQSTLAYLKNPPKSYQQAPVDLDAGFDLIRRQVEVGVFPNQYTFESAVHQLLYSAHDSHIALEGGVVGIFKFVNPFRWVSVSEDGFQIPKIYEYADLLKSRDQRAPYVASPVSLINDEPAELWLKDFAARNTHGFVEPHGEWNQAMYTVAGYGTGGYDVYRSTVFYPGPEITVTFKNGTGSQGSWHAIWSQKFSTPLIANGEDFYDYFVLGADTPTNIQHYGKDYKATPTASFALATTSASPVSSFMPVDTNAPDVANVKTSLQGWGYAYPRVADVIQDQLGNGGVLTGYFDKDSKLGVLSIPNFVNDPASPMSFTDTIAKFLREAKAAGMTKILIDLQQNSGGTQLLATDTFRQFLPNVDPYSGMRSRTFSKVGSLGSTFTQCFASNQSTFNDSMRYQFINSPFMISTEVDASDNQPFKSWEDYDRAHSDRDDQFTSVSRYSLSDENFVEVAAGLPGIYGYGTRPASGPQPYDAKDIVILTDGTCASTCDLFVEMMHHEAGVKTVVVGGVPHYGPMQARGGTRGALSYTSADLDRDFAAAQACNKSVGDTLPVRPTIYRDVTTLRVNVRDQIRKDEDQPLQFAYEAADCRIFFTKDTVNWFPALWQYATDAIFRNASTCVRESDAFKNTMQTDMTGPSQKQKESWRLSNPAMDLKQLEIASDVNAIDELVKKRPNMNRDGPDYIKPNAKGETPCPASGCGGSKCFEVQYCVSTLTNMGWYDTITLDQVCRPRCTKQTEARDCLGGFQCSLDGYCAPQQTRGEAECWYRRQARAAPPIALHAIAMPSVPNYSTMPPKPKTCPNGKAHC